MSRFDNSGLWWEDVQAKLRSDKTPKIQPVKSLPPPLCGGFPATPPGEKKACDIKLNLDRPTAVLDLEVYGNYFLCKFHLLPAGRPVWFERTLEDGLDVDSIYKLLKQYEIITFNGNNFDMPMLKLALTGATCEELKVACDDIILREMSAYQFERKYKLREWPFRIDHIDLIELTFGIASLKLYGGRLHCRKMQDLPYEPERILTREEMDLVREYCGNDLENTKLLFAKLQPQINLRRAMSNQYRMDLRSRSDAQIAEEVIRTEITKINGRKPVKREVKVGQFLYQRPSFITFNNPSLQKALDIVTTKPFEITKTGRIQMPKELLTLQIQMGCSKYQMGMGGLHSTESSVYHIADEEFMLFDWDVASYYPAIILNLGLYPQQLGKVFLDVYRSIVTERLAAKKSGDKVKADALKITINGSFGKLGSPYSSLYAPELMVQVTVTGQLSLLMLIEMMEDAGIPVVSANTDGIVLKCPTGRENDMRSIIAEWERRTGFEMESSMYAGLFSRDVNNYIAIKYDGSVKTKGCFSAGTLSKNPQNEICSIALVEYLKEGVPFEETISECTDITKFITVRQVNGGAVKDKDYIGKAVRWYMAKGVKGSINYKTNGNMVPRTIGAKPLMELPDELPDDIDYDWYVKECYNLL